MAYNPNLYSVDYSPWNKSVSTPIQGLISVTGVDGARAYPLPPNSSMPLFDAENDILYVKTTDGAGFPTVKAYKFEPIEAEPVKANFVTREEFDDLAKKIDALAQPSTPRRKKGETNAE